MLYLPNEQHVTIFHLKDLAMGRRRRINCKDIRHIHVPQYEGLKISDLKQYAEQHLDVMEALRQVDKEIDKLPRQYLANVVSNLVLVQLSCADDLILVSV